MAVRVSEFVLRAALETDDDAVLAIDDRLVVGGRRADVRRESAEMDEDRVEGDDHGEPGE
nr:hypothetical protein [Halosolutus halophilus]